jgi:methionyl-tRNA formyltransferase
MDQHSQAGSMNILIITEEDGFYLYEFFKTFYSLMGSAPYTISAVSILPPFNKKSSLALARQMIGFYGPLAFITMGIRHVINELTGHSVLGLTKRAAIPILDCAGSVNDAAYIAAVKNRAIDLIVSVAAPQRFKRELIKATKHGCINSHSALLPENRGMMPIFWALYKGAKATGITIHYIDEDLDRGDIIVQKEVVIGTESMHELIIKTKRMSAMLIESVLRDFCAGTVAATPMPPGGSYQSFPTPADIREFKRRGKRIR